MEEFYIKTIVGGGPTENIGITAYLFNKNKTLAIPLKLDKASTDAVLLAYQSVIQKRPIIHGTLENVIKGMGGKIIDIYIYMVMHDVYYCSLRLFANGRMSDFDIKFSDGLCMAVKTRCPISFEDSVLKQIALQLNHTALTQPQR